MQYDIVKLFCSLYPLNWFRHLLGTNLVAGFTDYLNAFYLLNIMLLIRRSYDPHSCEHNDY